MVALTPRSVATYPAPYNEIAISPDENYVYSGGNGSAHKILTKNLTTGNYDTAADITGGAPTGTVFCACFSPNSQRLYWVMGMGVYYADRIGGVWVYQGVFAATTTAPRSIAVSPDNTLIALGSTYTEVHSVGGAFTNTYNSNEGDTIEDLEWTPNSQQLISMTRSNGHICYTRTTPTGTTFTRAAVADSALKGNWQIAMHSDGDHYAAVNYLTGGGLFAYKRNATTGVWTRLTTAFSDGGYTAQSLTAAYFSKDFLFAASADGTSSRCYKRIGDTYVLETVTGYTNRAVNSGKGAMSSRSQTIATFTATSPYIAIYTGPTIGPAIEAPLKAPKATTSGTLKTRYKINSALNAPKAKIEGNAFVPVAGAGILTAPKATADGMVAVDTGLPGEIKSYFDILSGQVAARTDRVTFLDQVSSRLELYAVMTAPKAKSAGIITQGRVIQADLKPLSPKIAAFLKNPYVLSAALAAPKAKAAGLLSVELSSVVGALMAPKAVVDGTLFPRFAATSALHAPKARASGSLGNYYLTVGMVAPKAKTTGLVGVDATLSGILTAPKGKLSAVMTQPGQFVANLTAPKAHTVGLVAVEGRTLAGTLSAPKGVIDVLLEMPEGIYAALHAPKAKTASDIIVPWGTRGALVAPKAKFDGLALRYVRGDANMRAPKATLAGVIELANGIQDGSMIAPKARSAGELKLRYLMDGFHSTAPKGVTDGELRLIARFTGEMTAPKAIADGELFLRNLVNAELTAPKGSTEPSELKIIFNLEGIFSSAPKAVVDGLVGLRYYMDGLYTSAPAAQVSGHLGQGWEMVGVLTAPRPAVDGLLGIEEGFYGNLTAPKATSDGELILLHGVRAPLVAPKSLANGELYLRYLVEGIGSAPKGTTDILIAPKYTIEGELTAPSPNAAGELLNRYLVTGLYATAPAATLSGTLGFKVDGTLEASLTAPRGVLDGLLNNIDGARRRNLTVIRR